MEIIENFGILTSISWNSRKWADEPTPRDIRNSKYLYVQENGRMHESLNFAHEILPKEEGDYFIAYTPILNRLPDIENSKNVEIVFFISTDYKKDKNPRVIVGCYGFPQIDFFHRKARHTLYENYSWGNIKSHVNDIILFENRVRIHDIAIQQDKLLPEGKKLSQQGFNYLHSDNVLNIFKLAVALNPENDKLKKLSDRIRKVSVIA